MKVIVVGAGIVGGTLARSLVDRGHQVVLIEAGEVAGGTTSTSYGWLNSHKKHPDAYHAINWQGLRRWRQVLAARYPDLVAFQGHIEIAVSAEHRAALTARLERLRCLGYPAEWIDAATARHLTPVPVPPDAAIGWFDAEGHAYPDLLVRAIVAELTSEPGFALWHQKVASVSSTRASVTLTSGDTVDGDAVVLCAGHAVGALAATAGVRLPLVRPEAGGAAFGYLGYADVPRHGVRGLVTTDFLNLRPDGGHRLILQALDVDATADPRAAVTDEVRHEFARRLGRLLPGATVREVRVGHRVVPRDGLTAAGPVPCHGDAEAHLWIVSTHSGVVLAPWLAEVIAAEISGQPPHPMLDDFRPGRFQGLSASSDDTGYPAPRRPGDQ